jgi:adenine-specific DNA-methyltransferase
MCNLKKMCDEIFGEDCFIADFLWKKKSTTSNVEGAQVSPLADYTLCYGKTKTAVIKQRVKSKEERNYPHSDKEGDYRLAVIEKKDSGTYKRDSMKFEILGHKPRAGKRWQIGEETARLLEQKKRFIYDDGKIKLKIYDFEDRDTLSAQPNILDNHGTTDSASREVNEELFGIPELFDNPKPKELLMHLASIASNEGDIVCDFFAGSCSAAHAVYELNKESASGRQFLLIQLPELCDEGSEAFIAGYKTIADIGKERIRRVIKKLKKEYAQGSKKDELLLGDSKQATVCDLGFKVFKLDQSNFKIWEDVIGEKKKAENIEKQLELHIDHLDPKATNDDILYELLLKSGFPLTTKVEEKPLAGKMVYSIESGELLICLEKELTKEVITEMARLEPARVICLDQGFAGNDQLKTNAVQIMKSHGVNDFRTV